MIRWNPRKLAVAWVRAPAAAATRRGTRPGATRRVASTSCALRIAKFTAMSPSGAASATGEVAARSASRAARSISEASRCGTTMAMTTTANGTATRRTGRCRLNRTLPMPGPVSRRPRAGAHGPAPARSSRPAGRLSEVRTGGRRSSPSERSDAHVLRPGPRGRPIMGPIASTRWPRRGAPPRPRRPGPKRSVGGEARGMRRARRDRAARLAPRTPPLPPDGLRR